MKVNRIAPHSYLVVLDNGEEWKVEQVPMGWHRSMGTAVFFHFRKKDAIAALRRHNQMNSEEPPLS